jgi:hypothetical protein
VSASLLLPVQGFAGAGVDRALRDLSNISDQAAARANIGAAAMIRADGYHLAENKPFFNVSGVSAHNPAVLVDGSGRLVNSQGGFVDAYGNVLANQMIPVYAAAVNAQSIKEADDYCSANGVDTLHLPSGKYALKMGTTVRFTSKGGGRRTRSAVHRTGSNVNIKGHWTTLVAVPPDAADLVGLTNNGDWFAFFTSNQSMIVGTQKNLGFEGITFDGDRTYWDGLVEGSVPNLAVCHYFGVDGVTFRDLLVTVTGVGYSIRGGIVDNCARVVRENCRFINVVQGLWIQYCDGVRIRNELIDGFTEGLDFDEACWNVDIDGLTVKNVHSGQLGDVLDLTAIQHATIRNVLTENTGWILEAYGKPHSSPTFEEFWENTTNAPVANRINTLDLHAQGFNCANSYYNNVNESIRISNWRAAGDNVTPVTRRVWLDDFTMTKCSYAVVYECEDFRARRWRVDDSTAPATVGNLGGIKTTALMVAGSIVDSDTRPVGRLSGLLQDLKFTNIQRGVLTTEHNRDLRIRDVTGENYNTADVAATFGFLARGVSRFSDSMLDVDGVTMKSASANAIDFAVLSDGTEGQGIVAWGRNNRALSATKLLRAGAIRFAAGSGVVRSREILSLAAGVSSPQRFYMATQFNEAMIVERIRVHVPAGIVADATNYWLAYFYRKRPGVTAEQIGTGALNLGLTAITAGGIVELTSFVPSDALTLFMPGDVLRIDLHKQNTPVALPDITVSIDCLPVTS